MTPPAKLLPLCEADVLAGRILYYEDRDPRGCEIHWKWLLDKWTRVADKLEAEEARGLYAKQAPGEDLG